MGRHLERIEHMCKRDDKMISPSTESSDRHSLSASHAGFSPFYYLDSTAIKFLPEHKYKGDDQSLIYHHILSPFASFLVEKCTPTTLAPNAITVIGLCWMVSAYAICWIYSPTFVAVSGEDHAPRWIFAFNAFAMLIYQTLDNMDGKQARKTGSSSPLGLIVDHGCDAVNLLFGCTNWIVAMGLSSTVHSWQICVIIISQLILFYVATWEEYYTGKLVLPVCNGPSEGIILGAALSLSTFYVGRQFWHETFICDDYIRPFLPVVVASLIPEAGIQNLNLILYVTIVASTREAVEKVTNVIYHHGFKTLQNLFPILLLAVFASLTISGKNFERNPRTCLHLVYALFVEMVTQLMIDHTCKKKFNPCRMLMVPAVFLIFLQSASWITNESTDWYLAYYTTAVIVYLSMKIKIIVHELCAVLGVWCFDIVTPHSLKYKTR